MVEMARIYRRFMAWPRDVLLALRIKRRRDLMLSAASVREVRTHAKALAQLLTQRKGRT